MTGADVIWSVEALDAFLAKPKEMFPKTRMSFRGLKKEKDRANLIAFLAQYSEGAGDGAEVVEAKSDPEVSAEILAIEGDADYGEYLSGTCVTCHQADGTDQGLPSINGWPDKDFVTVMHAYKNKDRENPVMQQLAGALSNDEIASLATYFNQQP
jgi:cytochrome c